MPLINRARNCCEWCGVRNYTLREDTGAVVVLTAAHVHDKRPEACVLLNLAALCQRCHLRHDAKDRGPGGWERVRGPQLGAQHQQVPYGRLERLHWLEPSEPMHGPAGSSRRRRMRSC